MANAPTRHPYWDAALYPLILPFFIVFNFFQGGVFLFDTSSILKALVVLYGGLLLGTGFFFLWFRQIEKALCVTGVLLLAFFSRGFLVEGLLAIDNILSPSSIRILSWAGYIAIFMASPWVLFVLYKRNPQLNRYLNLAVLLMTMVPLVTIIQSYPSAESRNSEAFTTLSNQGPAPTPKHQPNIIQIVVDAYPSALALQEVYGFDNSHFETALTELGFSVPTNPTSPYPMTILSMAAMLNMQYLPHAGSCTPGDDCDLEPTHKLNTAVRTEDAGDYFKDLASAIQSNDVKKILESFDYRWVTLSTDYPPLEITPNTLSRCNRFGMSMFEQYMYRYTALSPVSQWLVKNYSIPLMDIALVDCHDSRINHLKKMAEDERPFIAFQHIMAPHFPYDIDEQGEFQWPVTPKWDAMLNKDPSKKGQFLSAFLNKLRHTNQYLKTYLKRIIEEVPGDTLIVIHGDHGARILMGESRETTCFKEIISPLVAVYATEGIPLTIPDDINLVNFYRILFRDLFGLNTPALPSRHSYIEWKALHRHTPVTPDEFADYCPTNAA